MHFIISLLLLRIIFSGISNNLFASSSFNRIFFYLREIFHQRRKFFEALLRRIFLILKPVFASKKKKISELELFLKKKKKCSTIYPRVYINSFSIFQRFQRQSWIKRQVIIISIVEFSYNFLIILSIDIYLFIYAINNIFVRFKRKKLMDI